MPDYDVIEIGAELPAFSIEVSPVQMVMYCAATWDFARFHYDAEFVKQFGLAKPAADPQMHGAFLARLLAGWAGEGVLRRLNLKYRLPCYVGETVTYHGKVVGKRLEGDARYLDCAVQASNRNGESIVEGTASILFQSHR